MHMKQMRTCLLMCVEMCCGVTLCQSVSCAGGLLHLIYIYLLLFASVIADVLLSFMSLAVKELTEVLLQEL